jgi:hypothetical protein
MRVQPGSEGDLLHSRGPLRRANWGHVTDSFFEGSENIENVRFDSKMLRMFCLFESVSLLRDEISVVYLYKTQLYTIFDRNILFIN